MSEKKINHGILNFEKILIKYIDSEKEKFIVKLNLYSFFDDYDEKFCAPELLNEFELTMHEITEYNEASDLWGLGVIIFTLFFREYPYKNDDTEEILYEIKKDKKV